MTRNAVRLNWLVKSLTTIRTRMQNFHEVTAKRERSVEKRSCGEEINLQLTRNAWKEVADGWQISNLEANHEAKDDEKERSAW